VAWEVPVPIYERSEEKISLDCPFKEKYRKGVICEVKKDKDDRKLKSKDLKPVQRPMI
jgi:hypothetical protein